MASSPDRVRERTSMARAAALLLIAGATLGLIQIVVPHPDDINTTAYAVIDAIGLLGAAVVWLFRERIPAAAYHLVGTFGIGCVALSIYYSGTGTSGDAENELLFLWPIIFACYFFGRRGLALQLGLVGLAYAVTLIAIDAGHAGIARWIGTMG